MKLDIVLNVVQRCLKLLNCVRLVENLKYNILISQYSYLIFQFLLLLIDDIYYNRLFLFMVNIW